MQKKDAAESKRQDDLVNLRQLLNLPVKSSAAVHTEQGATSTPPTDNKTDNETIGKTSQSTVPAVAATPDNDTMSSTKEHDFKMPMTTIDFLELKKLTGIHR